MRRRHRPAHPGCHEQPHGGAEERGHHDEREVHRMECDGAEVDDPALDRVGDVTAGQQGAADLEHGGDDERLLHRQGAAPTEVPKALATSLPPMLKAMKAPKMTVVMSTMRG